ncbi:unannotated protein [freshwater metagenome]|uniref:Unannotated protein n=1 Tax=freshwater metagenome TaxID=449393 RepID=A0A6J7RAV3_9ZZZZ
MHTVRDRGDRDVSRVEPGPEAGEHPARHLAVEQAHPIRALGEPQALQCHVENIGITVREGLGTELEDALDRDADLSVLAAEVLLDEITRESVDTCGNRRVGGEHRAGAAGFESLIEVEPAMALDELTDALDAEEACVALVHVEDLRRCGTGDAGEHADRPHAADAQQHLLLQAMLTTAAVQTVGYLALGCGVLLDVGVEEEERHASYLRDPDACGDAASAWYSERYLGRGSVGLAKQRHRAAIRIADRVVLKLPAITGEGLAEIAGPVEQADADDPDAEVARGLQVVAREDPEAAGVLRQGSGDAELGREVGDTSRGVRAQGLVPAIGCEIRMQVVAAATNPADEALVARELGEPLGGDLAEHSDRVLAGRRPQAGIDCGEQVAGLGVPRPAQVRRELLERGQRRGQDRADGESSNRSHGRTLACLITLACAPCRERPGFLPDSCVILQLLAHLSH